jgi:two-component system, NarL family, nitrate/nitrite response regulator NarL
MIRVLVVHKVRLTCDLMATALNEELDIHVVDFARSAEEAAAKLDSSPVDVVLVNINLPDNDALRITRSASRSLGGVKVLVTGLVQSKAAVLRCVEEGAAGYVLEEESLQDLVRKIRAVHANEFVIAPQMAGAMIARLAELKRQVTTIRTLAATDSYHEPTELTPREWEILSLIEQGMTNQQIADSLIIELGTVKNHVHNILRKLDVQSRKHAVIFARQLMTANGASKAGEKVGAPTKSLPFVQPLYRGRQSGSYPA